MGRACIAEWTTFPASNPVKKSEPSKKYSLLFKYVAARSVKKSYFACKLMVAEFSCRRALLVRAETLPKKNTLVLFNMHCVFKYSIPVFDCFWWQHSSEKCMSLQSRILHLKLLSFSTTETVVLQNIKWYQLHLLKMEHSLQRSSAVLYVENKTNHFFEGQASFLEK